MIARPADGRLRPDRADALIGCYQIEAAMSDTRAFQSFEDFYGFYLEEHRNRTSRRLHVIGTGLVLASATAGLLGRRRGLLWSAPLLGYGFAWIGHFFFEKNRPATFTHPFWSLRGDVRLFKETVSGRRPF